MTKSVLLIGGGGHAKVVAATLNQLNLKVLGCVDPKFRAGEPWLYNIQCLGDDELVLSYQPSQILLANGLGSLPGQTMRASVYLKYSALGFQFQSLRHPSAWLADDVEIGDGTQIMAGALIQPGSRIGDNTIVNTGAIVDHDCLVEEHVHIAPGVAISGGVHIGAGAHIGTGARITQALSIGEDAVVGAGAVVTKSVGAGQTVYPPRSTLKSAGSRK